MRRAEAGLTTAVPRRAGSQDRGPVRGVTGTAFPDARRPLWQSMELEVVIEDPRWTAVDIAALAEKAVASVLHKLSLDQKDCEIVILACDDARIAALNAAFRGKEAPTNVLSWPAQALTPPDLPEKDPDGTMPLGDMALAFETCAREAAEQGKTMTAHVTHLVVHGTLHLLGYDHERDEDAARMEALEVAILCNSGLDDPYS